MRKKFQQVMIAVMMIVLAAGIFGGCAGRASTDEEIIVPKGENSAALTEGMQESISGGISEQVQAPERYETEFSEGKVYVKVDAPVIVPDGAGFKLYHVLGRVFTQEDYDKVNQVLLAGGQLWDRDYEAMEKSNGFVKEEIEERIAILKEQQAGNGESKIVAAKEKTYEELISEWEELLKEAPEEPVIVDVPAVVGNSLTGYVTVGQEDYLVILHNDCDVNSQWAYFEVRGPEYRGTYIPVSSEDAEKAGCSILADKVREEAAALITQLGFNEFGVSGEEYVQVYSFDEMTDEEKILQTAYEVHFTRELDGIPVTYTHELGNTFQEGDTTWPYETIDLVFGEAGLQNFKWINPYQMEAAGSDYVFLLPFSDIQTVFEKIMPQKPSEWLQSESVEIFYEINKIRLGYMRVKEKGSSKEGTMVPVWDFFGTETIVYTDVDQQNVNARPYESLLTINAIDGTVIDRGLGY